MTRFSANFVLGGGVLVIVGALYVLTQMFAGADAPRSLASATLLGATGGLLAFQGLRMRKGSTR